MGTGGLFVRFATGMAVGIAAVVAGFSATAARGSSGAERSALDLRLSRVASQLAGKAVEVRCWSHPEWQHLLRGDSASSLHRVNAQTLGFADIFGTRENLSPEVCGSLATLANDRVVPRAPLAELRLAQAVVTLAHEPQHSKGIVAEARAECYAIQLARETAVDLGATPQDGASLEALYWSHYGEELPDYRSPECRNGGAYDLRPADPKFP